jgi:hypothetical protein
MRAGIALHVTLQDRCQLEAIVGDRDIPQKPIGRAKIILANGCGITKLRQRRNKKM